MPGGPPEELVERRGEIRPGGRHQPADVGGVHRCQRYGSDVSRRVTPPPSTVGPVDPMPAPGELIEAFSPQPGRCFRMVYSRQLQSTHCRGEAAWKGLWTDRKGASWYVEACREHAPKVTSAASVGD